MNTWPITAILILTASGCTNARVSRCSGEQASAAEDGVDRLKTWMDLQDAFTQFASCDDGAIAEGWSDFVAGMLATKWTELAELQRLSAADREFHSFVIRHISESAAQDDLKQALDNARERCPFSGTALCAEIAEAINRLETR